MPFVYLDTCVFIGGFETAGPMATSLREFFVELQKHPFFAVTSELTIAELLAPIKHAAAMTMEERRNLYIPLIDDGAFIEMRPVTRSILLATAPLRVQHPQRLPDAIHIATALEAGCGFFLSQDRDARRLPPSLTWVGMNSAGIATVLEALRA
ncbi:MAG: type II toxin-antitoxin system VapC family toxin [Beijerinckiaceae bacterium]|nr:type II toxin-antitoxin system VapC family toxin [Beijerinckiaceae bacterium]